MDHSEIKIRDLKVYAYHGVYSEERQKGQNFYVDVLLTQDIYDAGMQDDLSLSTNYGEVCVFIDHWMRENTFCLIEAVCERLAEAILLKFSLVRAVKLEVKKPDAPIPLPFGSVSVCVKRSWHTAYLSVGSNMGDRRKFIEEGIKALGSQPHTKVKEISGLIVTKPYGGVEQEDFLNGAVKIETMLSPQRLLDFLHEIERAAGRERKIHWGPRTLDLDILFYDKMVCEDENLIIPHIDMENREFVLKPMCEIAPWFRHPIFKKTMSQLCEELAKHQDSHEE